MSGPKTTRADDEQILDLLDWRRDGFSSYAIAPHFGLNPERVRVLTNRVKADDIAYSGPEAAEAYWS